MPLHVRSRIKGHRGKDAASEMDFFFVLNFFCMQAEEQRGFAPWVENGQQQGGKTTKGGQLIPPPPLFPHIPLFLSTSGLMQRKRGPLAVSDHSCEVN
uniref:Uncharacterized protein n=1 Tax=Nothobranchius furzeri TaxID=105023 RepID=A0A1A8AFS6_NOTFU